MLMLLALCLPMTSCGDDDDGGAPSAGNVTVRNNSSSSLYSFTFVFLNDDDETVSQFNCGTILQGKTAVTEIPAGATKYWFGAVIGNYVVMSANYNISTKVVEITDNTYWPYVTEN